MQQSTRDDGYGYPFDVPEITVDGYGEAYSPQWIYDWQDDVVIVRRGNTAYKYCRKIRTEVLMRSPSGEEKWVLGNDYSQAEEEGWQYAEESRDAQFFEVIEYDLKNKTKKTYSCNLVSEDRMEAYELRDIVGDEDDYDENDEAGDENYDENEYEIEDGELINYKGNGGDIWIPKVVKYIGYESCCGCSALTSVHIQDSVIAIEDKAFQNCSGVTSVRIPLSVTSIGAYAFRGCSALTSIRLSPNITDIGGNAFSRCSALTSIKVWANNPTYYSENNCLIERKTNTLITGCKTSIIPDSVTSIGEEAFCGCSGLTSIEIPSSVISIKYCAFYDCSGLTSVRIPSSVTSIEDSAFNGCSELTSIEIPSSVTSIGRLAFAYCGKFTTINYQGTIAQWNTIEKDDSWDKGINNYIIHCTDGDITNDETGKKL